MAGTVAHTAQAADCWYAMHVIRKKTWWQTLVNAFVSWHACSQVFACLASQPHAFTHECTSAACSHQNINAHAYAGVNVTKTQEWSVRYDDEGFDQCGCSKGSGWVPTLQLCVKVTAACVRIACAEPVAGLVSGQSVDSH